MATTNKRIIPGEQLALTASTLYTAPASTRCVVKRLSFCNTSGAPAAVTLYLVPSGGTAGDASTVTKTRTIAAAETWNCPDAEGHVIEAGGTIQALADTATAVTVIGSGVEIV